jgi:RNA polymerase sigma factor for flagellar operon FliA
MEESTLVQDSLSAIPKRASKKVDPAWQEQMVLQYAPLIKYIAGRLAPAPAVPHFQTISSGSGIIGLIDAVQKFDPAKISTSRPTPSLHQGAYADELGAWIGPRSARKKSNLIENAYVQLQGAECPAEAEEVAGVLGLELEEFYQLLDETKTVSLVALEGRKGSAGSLGLVETDLDEILQDDKSRDSFLEVHFSELQGIMMQAIESLPDKEKLLVSLYYYEELTMKEIGQIMGYTESRISQLHTQAMYRLRNKLRGYSQEMGE